MRQSMVKSVVRVAAASSLVALAGACDRASEAERTLSEARAEMLALHTGADAAPSTLRQETYEKVSRSLQSAVSGLEGAAASSAHGLQADAQAGLGHIASADASERSRRIRNLIGRVRTAAEHHAAYSAAAEALAQVDTDPQLDALRDLVEDLRADLRELGEVRRIAASELQGVRDRAEAELSQARDLRAQADQVRSGSADASASQRAGAAERAYELERRADGHEKQAAEWLAQMGQAEPRLEMMDLDYANFEKRIALVQEAGERLGRRAATREELEAGQRAQAAETAAKFRELIGEMDTLLEGPFTEAVSSAESSYQNAIRSMRSAMQSVDRDTRGARAIELAGIRQSLASLKRTESRTVASVASTLRWAAGLEPAMLDGQALTAKADELEARAEEALAASAESYKSAREDLASAGARGEQAERIDALVQMIAQTERAMGFGEQAPPPPSPPGESAPDDAGTMQDEG